MGAMRKQVAGEHTSPPKFEEVVRELESIVQSMENGQLELEASLHAYQRGTELLNLCHAQLSTAEQKIQVLEQGVMKTFEAAIST